MDELAVGIAGPQHHPDARLDGIKGGAAVIVDAGIDARDQGDVGKAAARPFRPHGDHRLGVVKALRLGVSCDHHPVGHLAGDLQHQIAAAGDDEGNIVPRLDIELAVVEVHDLAVEIDAAAENPRMMAVMYVDLDGFKAVNDGRGHNAGDMLLKIVAQRLNGCIRKSDLAARIGGDEFVVVLRNVKTLAIVATRARDIVAMMGEPFDVDGDRSAEIGASVGVALFPDDGATPDSLLKAADGAMYGVKQGGKNAVAFAS